MTDFGTDFFCDEDLAPTLRRGTGVEMVRNAVFHRLTTAQILAAPGDKSSDYVLGVSALTVTILEAQ